MTEYTLSPGEQKMLARSSVVVVGAGGLGSPALTYLVCAGVGRVTIVESDDVELSNLNRQFLHGSRTLHSPKARSAQERLLDLNPEVQVLIVESRLVRSTLDGVFGDADVVVDATDNLETRLAISHWCSGELVPCVWGAVFGMSGYASTFAGGGGHTYADVFGNGADGLDSLEPAVAGVVGAVCGVIGSMMALEALKLLVGRSAGLVDQLLHFDGATGEVRHLRLRAGTSAGTGGAPRDHEGVGTFGTHPARRA